MKTVIVSGIETFIGKALVNKLINNDIFVYALCDNSGLESNIWGTDKLNEKLHILSSDVDNLEEIVVNVQDRIDVFYHMGWKGLSGKALYDPLIQIDNCKILINYMKLAINVGCKKFIGLGSISQYENIYGERRVLGDRERYYRSCKDFCDKVGREYGNELGIQFIWPICTNVYGEGENSAERFIYNIIRVMKSNGVMDVSEGRQLYDFVYIDDVISALYLLGMTGKKNRNYVIGSGKAKSLREWIEQIPTILDSSGKFNFGKRLYNGAFLGEECFDIRELVEDTGWTPIVEFKEGVIRTADWIKKINNE